MNSLLQGKCAGVYRNILFIYFFFNFRNIFLIFNKNEYRNIFKDLKQNLNRSKTVEEKEILLM